MKKVLIACLLMISLCPLFATSFKIGGSLSTGCELFTGEATVPQINFGADLELPQVYVDETSCISLPIRFSYVSDFVTVGRYTTVKSMKLGLGIRYMYRINEKWELGVGATGGLWGFFAAENDIKTTVYHSLEARCAYNLAKHVSICVPLCFTSASFGNTINLSVILNIH